MKDNGIIVPLAFPDTLIKKVEGSKRIENIFSKKGVFKVGHAALLLIKKGEKKIHYFDFGRYISPHRYGRVRNEKHDIELNFSIEAKWKNDKLQNKDEILIFLEKNPHLTHGDGRLVASFCKKINFEKAYNFIQDLINENFILYDIKGKNTTNCSRFVSSTIYNSTTCLKVKKGLKKLNFITPSPIGIVEKSKGNEKSYNIYKGKVEEHPKGYLWRMLKEFILKNYEVKKIHNYYTPLGKPPFKNGQWLGGSGDGAWYSLEKKDENTFIGKKTINKSKPYEGEFISDKKINLTKEFKIIYPSNTLFFTIEQRGEKIKLKKKV